MIGFIQCIYFSYRMKLERFFDNISILAMEMKAVRKNVTKNQHYISEFILKHFANDKEQVSECLVNKGKIYTTHVSRSMSERYIYEHSDLEQNSLENAFSEIEDYVAPKFNKILEIIQGFGEGDNIDGVVPLIEDILGELLIFYYRSGALLHEYAFDILEKKHRDDILEKLLKNITNSRYLYELKRTIIDYYSISIIASEGNDLILSDQYISTAALGIKSRFMNITNRQIGLKDVIILIPLSSRYYIVFFNGNKPSYIKDGKTNFLDNTQVMKINKVIINNSYNKCIALKKEKIEEVLPYYKHKSPLGVIAKYGNGRYHDIKLKKEVFFYEDDEIAFDFFATMKFLKYKKTGRNETCPCGSGRKYKRCCLKYYIKAEKVMHDIVNKVNPTEYMVNPCGIIEKSIGEIISFEEPKLLKQIKQID